MIIDPQTGTLQLSAEAIVSANMTRAALTDEWEPWLFDQQNAPSGYRLVMNKLYQGQQGYLIIMFSSAGQGQVSRWLLTIDSLLDIKQSKPEGKMTTQARAWLKEFSGVQLPLSASWGTIDAVYDPHNMATYISCNYVSSVATNQ